MNPNSFEDLCLSKPILRAVSENGYTEPTDIQFRAIPEVLTGNDLMAAAQTGTGKTAAFALPILELLQRRSPRKRDAIRVLILTPTRELAVQIEENIRTYGRYLAFKTAVVFGGVSQVGQVRAIRTFPEILVATPGRLLDLVQQRQVQLNGIEILVLDEADRMLDMGFIRDVRKIVSETPKKRQTLLFSATLSREISTLAGDMLANPAMVQTTPDSSISGNISQKVLFVDQSNKGSLLTQILKGKDVRRALVFTRTKHRANRVAIALSANGISADAIHSNKSQNARQRTLTDFDRGHITVLVATDILSRGIDVDKISHVINYEMPNDAASYVHRVGRTARAGAAGVALSLCDASEVPMLREIEKLTKSPLATLEDHPYHSSIAASLQQPRSSAPGGGARPPVWRSFGPRGRAAGRHR